MLQLNGEKNYKEDNHDISEYSYPHRGFVFEQQDAKGYKIILCFRKWKGSDCAFSKYIDFYTVDFINPMTQQMVTTKKRNFTKNARHLNHSYEIFLGSRYPDYGNAIKKIGKQCLKNPKDWPEASMKLI